MKFCAFWFRRDIRIEDNCGLYHALQSGLQVIPVFIFDESILEKLENKEDARVGFIYQQIQQLKLLLQTYGSDLIVRHGKPIDVWKQLTSEFRISQVVYNRDYEYYAKDRDHKVSEFLKSRGVKVSSYKDHVLFEKDEVLKDDGNPYTVFTAYKNKINKLLLQDGANASESKWLESYPSEHFVDAFFKSKKTDLLSLESIGFRKSSLSLPDKIVAIKVISQYDKMRDFPAIDGTSHLGIHFRFGTISIREKARKAILFNQVYFSELLWRDFYSMILQAFPYVEQQSFKPAYDRIRWENDETLFRAWCEGRTGYPMVDAGIRQLNLTGFMHNRLRMITASFLVKHLLIDWRWGEAYFAEKLLDFDLASNNGGWQWAAGCGTDAAPYFRIFSPDAQQKRFDPKGVFIRKWIPEYGTDAYLNPIVEHASSRARCLKVFKNALQ